MHGQQRTGLDLIAHRDTGEQCRGHHQHRPPVGEPLGEPEPLDPYPHVGPLGACRRRGRLISARRFPGGSPSPSWPARTRGSTPSPASTRAEAEPALRQAADPADVRRHRVLRAPVLRLYEASCGYFAVPPRQMTLAQASLLAGLVQAPSAYDPLVHLGLARARQHYVIDRLAATGISPAPARAAQIAPLQLHSGGTAGALGSRSAWGEQAATSPGRVVSRAATCVADWRLGKVTSGRNDVAGHRRRSW